MRRLIVMGAGVLDPLTGVAVLPLGVLAARRTDGLYRGQAARLIAAAVQTRGARASWDRRWTVLHADYAWVAGPAWRRPGRRLRSRTRRNTAPTRRRTWSQVFKTAALAKTYWKKACPGCGDGSVRGTAVPTGGTEVDRSQPLAPPGASVIACVAVCGGLVVPVEGTGERRRVADRQVVQRSSCSRRHRLVAPQSARAAPDRPNRACRPGPCQCVQAPLSRATRAAPCLASSHSEGGSNGRTTLGTELQEGQLFPTTRDEGWVRTGTTEVALDHAHLNPGSCTAMRLRSDRVLQRMRSNWSTAS